MEVVKLRPILGTVFLVQPLAQPNVDRVASKSIIGVFVKTKGQQNKRHALVSGFTEIN